MDGYVRSPSVDYDLDRMRAERIAILQERCIPMMLAKTIWVR